MPFNAPRQRRHHFRRSFGLRKNEVAQRLGYFCAVTAFGSLSYAAGCRTVMYNSKPSRTAFRVAMRRAAHQLLENPPVFADPLALPILGPDGVAELNATLPKHAEHGSRSLRAFVAVRSRYAEDQLADAVLKGVRQYVLLGAGLDTFAYRNPHRELRVFEVDHPATQAWKRELLAASGIAIPPHAVLAPMNFETQSLAGVLSQGGFHENEPAFFAWLGVVPYLTDEGFRSTLHFMAAMPPGTGVVFDYSIPRSLAGFGERIAFDAMANRVARAGEPFRLFFEPAQLVHLLQSLGFSQIEDLDSGAINARYFQSRTDGFRTHGVMGRLLCARK